ncbi:Mog1p/PsbP-like protein [Zopfia rhizophila CBS 207.26]|uniref:Mog1p/PsbP-like protein n=1 Tax=Zopfia rhizophila CBS 207.26 TaxID=1314779 RepID=A0A6A6DC51_9PEZI|nr:Mog1p/PsbP-like protein [Zopfia rhizophila CBS 207.26]
MSFKHTELYGGAITVDLPVGFGDASDIRQIPDHQEVYLDASGYTSIVFDILERVEKPTNEEALQYHFADLIDGTGDETNVLNQGSAKMEKIPNNPLLTLTYIQTPPSETHPRRKQPEFVSINLLLLRLEKETTDIVITINVPHYAGEYAKNEADGAVTGLMKDAEVVKERILASFDIKYWGLFNGN